MIYLDNAATSFPKPDEVKEAVNICIDKWCANPGRSGHRNAMKSNIEIMEARKSIAGLIGAEAREIIFTCNCTLALNMGIKGVINRGDHVITTMMEHNSVLRPLYALKKYGVETSLLKCNSSGMPDIGALKSAVRKNTRMIICCLSSNVCGNIMPVEEIGEFARKNNILFLIDGAQGLGSIEIDVNNVNADMLAASGHKSLLGPQGTGFLYVKDGLQIRSMTEGGTGTESQNMSQPMHRPEGMEAGTLNVPGITGLHAGIEYIRKIGIEKIRKRESDLTEYLQEELKEIPEVKMYGVGNPVGNSGITAFNVGNYDSEKTAAILDEKYGIAVRAGFHCAPMAHKALDTGSSGCVRVSVGPFTTYDEITSLINAIREIAENIIEM